MELLNKKMNRKDFLKNSLAGGVFLGMASLGVSSLFNIKPGSSDGGRADNSYGNSVYGGRKR